MEQSPGCKTYLTYAKSNLNCRFVTRFFFCKLKMLIEQYLRKLHSPTVFSFDFTFTINILFADPLIRCLDDRLTPFYMKSIEFNANIRHNPVQSARESLFIPYVGNGFFGVEIQPNANMYIKYGRYLSQPVQFHPIVSVTHRSTFQNNEAYVVDYVNGFVHR